jgi:membrane protein required for colicin V production
MTLLDFFILIPIGYFAFRGFMSGLIKEVLSIAGVVIAVFMTFWYMDDVAILFSPLFENPDHAVIAAGILIFVIIVGAVQFVAFATQKFLEVIKINFINRLAGLLFGAVKSAIVISAILLLFAGFNLPGEESRNNSATYSYIIYVAPAVFDMAAMIYPGAENFIETIEQTIEDSNPIKSLPIFENLSL